MKNPEYFIQSGEGVQGCTSSVHYLEEKSGFQESTCRNGQLNCLAEQK